MIRDELQTVVEAVLPCDGVNDRNASLDLIRIDRYFTRWIRNVSQFGCLKGVVTAERVALDDWRKGVDRCRRAKAGRSGPSIGINSTEAVDVAAEADLAIAADAACTSLRSEFDGGPEESIWHACEEQRWLFGTWVTPHRHAVDLE